MPEGNSTQLDTEVKLKSTGAFCIVIIFICIISKLSNFPKNQTISLFVGMHLSINLIEWIYYFVSAKKLHDIKVHTRFVNEFQSDFGKISIPYDIEVQPNNSIRSVSALSALRGSNQYRLITSTCDVSYHALLLALIVYGKSNDIHVWLAYLVVFGLYCVSCWEYNTICMIHTSFHIFGAFLAALMPFCFALQTSWSMISIFLLSIAYSSFVLQHIIIVIESLLKKYTTTTVHIISVCCISLELIGLIFSGISLCSFIANLQ